MKKICMAVSVMSIFALSTFSSCTKKDSDVSTASALMDDWRLKKFSLDDGNSELEQREIDGAYELFVDYPILTFNRDFTGSINSLPYFPTLFGEHNFEWTTNERKRELIITTQSGEVTIAQIRFQDINHYAILQTSFSQAYGAPVWMFFERK
ncbi:MAG TPA: hypothetical protein VL098_11405 [Flavipsychrobacter sp.]|nr:hypothetical protein [Flavipsychrobacter sp.]